MSRVMLGVVAICFAALALSSSPAKADVPGIGSLICQQLQLGYTPGQLAELLHRGGPQWSASQYLVTIYNTEGLC